MPIKYPIAPEKTPHSNNHPMIKVLILLVVVQIAMIATLLYFQTERNIEAEYQVDQTCWPGEGKPEKMLRPLHKLPCDRLPINIRRKA